MTTVEKERFFICVGVSKKTSKRYIALVADVGYRRIFLTFSTADIAEILGISPVTLWDMANSIQSDDLPSMTSLDYFSSQKSL